MSALVLFREWLLPVLYWGQALASAARVLALRPERAVVRARF